MDFQTMLKKVKQKQYKSKREFAEDLELIWNNCFTYNTGDVRANLFVCGSLLYSRTIEPSTSPLCYTPSREVQKATEEYH